MRIILDARSLRYYPVSTPGFTGATEIMLHKLAEGLAMKGHEVHVVTPDLTRERQRVLNWIVRDLSSKDPGRSVEWWWPPNNHPTYADVVVGFHNLANVHDYEAPVLVLASNGLEPEMAGLEEMVDAVVCFSQTHVAMFAETMPAVKEKLHAIGLGVNLGDYEADVKRVPGRLLWASDPARGLWHMLDIFDALKPLVPEATLHVAYDFAGKLNEHRWAAHSLAQAFLECDRRIKADPSITSLGPLLHEQMAKEQLECDVFAYPLDPISPGSELFCCTAMEAAAAGCPLVLSSVEALPEVFGEHAKMLPPPGTFVPDSERRCDAKDWAETIAEIMHNPAAWLERVRVRDFAVDHTWDRTVREWDTLLTELVSRSEVEPCLSSPASS